MLIVDINAIKKYLSDIILLYYDIIVSKYIFVLFYYKERYVIWYYDILIKRVIFQNGLNLDR
jgi:hypothetical protein